MLIAVGLFFAPWGWLEWPIYVLAALAWVTVAQRILFVRRQLRELAEAAGLVPYDRGSAPSVGGDDQGARIEVLLAAAANHRGGAWPPSRRPTPAPPSSSRRNATASASRPTPRAGADHLPLGRPARQLLAWGAVNARAPSPAVPQVAFQLQLRRLDRAERLPGLRGPAAPWKVAACTAPDGTHWALQAWQRMLPNYGAPTPDRAAWELAALALVGPAARSRDLDGLVVPALPPPLRPAHVPAAAACSASARPASACRSNVRPERLRRHVQLHVRRRLEAREQLPDARADRGLLLRLPPARPAPVGAEEVPRDGDRPGVTPDVMWAGPAPGATTPRADAEANVAQRTVLGPIHAARSTELGRVSTATGGTAARRGRVLALWLLALPRGLGILVRMPTPLKGRSSARPPAADPTSTTWPLASSPTASTSRTDRGVAAAKC